MRMRSIKAGDNDALTKFCRLLLSSSFCYLNTIGRLGTSLVLQILPKSYVQQIPPRERRGEADHADCYVNEAL